MMILAFLSAWPSPSGGRGDDAGRPAEAVLERAERVTSLRVPGAPPFRLRLRAEFSLKNGGFMEANYDLVWLRPDWWREEVKLPGFTDVAIAQDRVLWRKRNTEYVPMMEWLLMSLVRADRAGALSDRESVTGIRDREEAGHRLACVESRRDLFDVRERCFDATTGLLTVRQDRFFDRVYEYHDWATLGVRRFPQKIRVLQFSKQVAELQLVQIEHVDPGQVRSFTVAEDAKQELWCADMSPAGVLGGDLPRFPPPRNFLGPRAPLPHSLVIYMRVGVDGVPHDLRSLATPPGRSLDAETSAFLESLRFRPATCHGAAVESEWVDEVVLPR
jgi:hypothetical protein